VKSSWSDLAIFGGSRSFRQPLHVGTPNIGSPERFFDRARDILERKVLTNFGFYVREFERALGDYLGVKHCITVCNATVALEITARALELRGEVIVPSMTFVATAHALQWQEITPVFCDIDPSTHLLDPQKVEAMITPRTSGILGVHLWGRPCDIEQLSEIARKHNLKLFFDAAHAFGCSYQGRMIGRFGDAEVLSFHATKVLNSFEGGAIVTNNDQLAEKVRWMTNFGFAGRDNVVYLGVNGKMSEIQAAMGLTSLESFDTFVRHGRANYHAYRAGLSGIPGIRLREFDELERNNFQYIIIEVNPDVVGLSRDELLAVLSAENIDARRYFYPGCHRMEPYRSYYPHAGLLLPNTERIVERVLALPTGMAVSQEDIGVITSLIAKVVEWAPQVRDAMTGLNK